MHTLITTSENKIMSFGHGKYGKLGTGDEDDSPFPSKIMMPTRAVKIAQCIAGYHISIAIDFDDLIIYTWGYSGRGILGRSTEISSAPRKIDLAIKKIDHQKLVKEGESKSFNKFPTQIKKVAIGSVNTLVLTDTGVLFLYGGDEYSQSGQTTENKRKREKMVSSSQNNSKAMQLLFLIPYQINIHIPKRVEIIDIAMGAHHIIALSKFHEMYSWGRNDEGQLGQGFMVRSIETPKVIESMLSERIKAVYA